MTTSSSSCLLRGSWSPSRPSLVPWRTARRPDLHSSTLLECASKQLIETPPLPIPPWYLRVGILRVHGCLAPIRQERTHIYCVVVRPLPNRHNVSTFHEIKLATNQPYVACEHGPAFQHFVDITNLNDATIGWDGPSVQFLEAASARPLQQYRNAL